MRGSECPGHSEIAKYLEPKEIGCSNGALESFVFKTSFIRLDNETGVVLARDMNGSRLGRAYSRASTHQSLSRQQKDSPRWCSKRRLRQSAVFITCDERRLGGAVPKLSNGWRALFEAGPYF